jgi:hypothetical protein
MRRAIVLLIAVGSFAFGSLAGCGSGNSSHGSMDASLPTDGPVATDGYRVTEARADADGTTAADGGSSDAGDVGPDSLGGDEAGDVATEADDTDAVASEGAADPLSNLCPTECSDADAACSTPDVAGDPPTPAGYQPMPQSQVTSAMTTWAVGILHDPFTYPMFSCATETFGTLAVLARVEWLPPDFQTSVVHRGVVLYERGD